MIQLTNRDICCGCAACADACPRSCIEMRTDEEGFRYPFVQTDACIACGLCDRICPFHETAVEKSKPIVYAVKNLDEDIRMISSSGGVFSLLAAEVLQRGGIVFGAVFSDDWKEVYHISAETVEELSRFRSSKYLQSRTDAIYSAVKKELLAGRCVLFSGTPCQILALRKYLQKEYENLFCVDLICHGVPSPVVWKCYLEYLEKKYAGTVKNVNFRYKQCPLEDVIISQTQSETKLLFSKDSNPYMQMFLKNECLRPSCYACKAKEVGSGSDITLGDFWGINRIAPEMNDGKGTSVVLIRTENGACLFNAVRGQTETKEVNYESVGNFNPSLVESTVRPQKRNSFFDDFQALPWDKLTKKYCLSRKEMFLRKAKRHLKFAIRKVLKKPSGMGEKLEMTYGIMIEMQNGHLS